MNPGTTAVARALEVLAALGEPAAAEDGLGVVRLAQLVQADKSQLSRTLQTLDEHGFVARDPDTSSYRLGWRVFALAMRVGERTLLAEAPAVLRALVREFDESVHLSVRHGDHLLTLLSESPAHTLHAPGRVGSEAPLATTSAGRALVMDLAPEELAALGLGASGPAIAEARALGYAIVREEFEPGLIAAAAPIRDPAGRIVAALNLSAPTFRFDGRLEQAAQAIVRAAERLSHAIGASAGS